MSLFGQGQEKTEPATPKRLLEARQKGNVARSPDLVPASVFLCLILVCYVLKDWFFYYIARVWVHYLTSFTSWELTTASATAILWSAGAFCLQILAPIFLVALLAAIAVNLLQVGFLFSPQALVPKLERISITKGLARMFSVRGAMNFAKALLKVCAIGGLVFWLVRRDLGALMILLNAAPAKGLILVTDMVFRIAATAAVAYLGLAVLDYIYQRRTHQKEMMMTRTEVKEEYRQTEGDPLVRGWLRRRQRQAMLNRIQQQVPKATVVITNPVHVAVALAYEEGMNAPRIVAKGAGYLAMCIKKVAEEHGVPVIEDRSVARFLYQKVEVGEEIPLVLYQAVAEIIALVYRLRKNR